MHVRFAIENEDENGCSGGVTGFIHKVTPLRKLGAKLGAGTAFPIWGGRGRRRVGRRKVLIHLDFGSWWRAVAGGGGRRW